MTPVVWSSRYFADIGDHVMPMRKFGLVADAIRADGGEIVEAERASDADLLRVHTAEYVAAMATGEPRELAQSQKFPWSAELAEAVRWTNGGLITALRIALDQRVCGNLASGFHHAHAGHGEGFCTFNGLVVALEALRIGRALVIDCDLHFGNGTATLLEPRTGWYQVSIYGNGYWANTAYRDATAFVPPRTFDRTSCVPVAPGTSGDAYVEIVRQNVRAAITHARPDVILYQAGADPYKEDPYSPLDVDLADLAARDRFVFEAARDARIPIAWVLAGGYTRDVTKVVAAHHQTWKAANQVF